MFGINRSVHPAHVGDGDSARQRRQRIAQLRMRKQDGGSRDDGGVVRWKVVPIVFEHHEAVGVDESTGRVAGDEVNLSVSECPVDQ